MAKGKNTPQPSEKNIDNLFKAIRDNNLVALAAELAVWKERGFSLTSKNSITGNTALHVAAERGNLEAFKMLAEADAVS